MPPSTTVPTTPTSTDQVLSNPDLLTQILTRIPTKPLLKLKPTNKLFYSLITSPPFSLLHSLHHTHHPSSALIFQTHHPNHPLFSFIPLSPLSPPPPLPPLPSSLSPLQSSNGLLLSHSPLLLLNPTTSSSTPLPIPPPPSPLLSLIFDPASSPFYYLVSVHDCGYRETYCEGYDNTSPSLSALSPHSYSLDVYSSRERVWRRGVDSFDAPFDTEFERGVSCGSRVYWLSHTETMVGFDVESGSVVSVKMPQGKVDGVYIERFRYLGESCGFLHLVEIATNCVSEFHVLEMRGEEWVKRFRVELDVLGRGFEREMFQDSCDRFGRRLRFYAFSVLAVVRKGRGDEGEEERLVVSMPGKVVSYDMEKKVSRLLCDVVDESDKWLPFKGYNAYQYIESLYSL